MEKGHSPFVVHEVAGTVYRYKVGVSAFCAEILMERSSGIVPTGDWVGLGIPT